MAAITLHYGETMIRARFTEYLQRFVRLSSRYEEDTMGLTSVGFPSQPYTESDAGEFGLLGTGLVFLDDLAGARELQMNASRIEGWRRTKSYDYYRKVRSSCAYLFYLADGLMFYLRISELIWRLTLFKASI